MHKRLSPIHQLYLCHYLHIKTTGKPGKALCFNTFLPANNRDFTGCETGSIANISFVLLSGVTAHVHFRVRPWISKPSRVRQPSCQIPSYVFFVIMRGYDSPPPFINTESVILQNAPHSQCLLAMGRIAFVGLWRSLRKKFAKLKKFKGGTEKHSLVLTGG